MAKNPIQPQNGLSLPEFLASYDSEEQCAAVLFAWRWPQLLQVTLKRDAQ